MNSEKLQLTLCGLMPPSFFKSRKVPVAPLRAANLALLFDFSVAIAAFAALFSYYYNITTPVTTVSSTLLPGQTCTALSPRRGVTFYSANTSENGQFASPFYTRNECVALLQKQQVCAAGNRFDFLSVLGVSNPVNAQYFESGYLTFTPSQAAGVTTELATLYQPSVAFPRPAVSEQFVGSGNTWYVYNYARDSVAEYTNVYLTNPIVDSNYSGSTTGTNEKVYLQNGLTSFVFTESDVQFEKNGSAFQLQTSSAETVSALLTINDNHFYQLEIAASFANSVGVAGNKNTRPISVAIDINGNVYVADFGNNLIRRIDAITGDITNQGISETPTFDRPFYVSLDESNNVYVIDYTNSNNNLFRQINAITGEVIYIGVSSAANPYKPTGLAVDGPGNVYISDFNNNLVLRIDSLTRVVTYLTDGGTPFSGPQGVTVDYTGYIYVADNGNNEVKIIDSNGNSNFGLYFPNPTGLAADRNGNLYVIDSSKVLYYVSALTIHGLDPNGYYNIPFVSPLRFVAVDGSGNAFVTDEKALIHRLLPTANLGQSASLPFLNPTGVTVDGSENVYVADYGNSLVRRIDAISGSVTNLGASATPAFLYSRGVAVDGSGNVYVADTGNSLVRRIDVITNAVTNLGISASPKFSYPYGVAVDGSGNVYVADTDNSLVRQINIATQDVINLGVSASLPFLNPTGVAVDGFGNVYVADAGNNLVRRIDAITGVVADLGSSVSPAFSYPYGVAVDGSGNVYVGDANNNLVRQIDAVSGNVTDLGNVLTSPAFNRPFGVAVDGYGNVVVADFQNSLVRVIYVNPNLAVPMKTLGLFWNPTANVNSVESSNSTLGSFNVIATIPTVNQLHIMYGVNSDHDCKASYRSSSNFICTNTNVFSQFNEKYQVLITGFAYNYALVSSKLTRQSVYISAVYKSNNLPVESIPRNSSGPLPTVYFDTTGKVATVIIGIFDTPKGTVLFTSYAPQPVSLLIGNAADSGVASDLSRYYNNLDSSMVHLNGYFKNFISLMQSSSSIQASTLPGKPSRYVSLQLVDTLGGALRTVTYDTFTDQYFTPNVPINAAATKYMLAYTYGVCNGTITKSVVELSGSLDYSVLCTKQNGLYYQSPNVYYSLPVQCLGIPYGKLLSQCPSVTANMASLVNATCQKSIEKVCATQYDENPPYTCVSYTRSSILTVLSLSFSTTMAIIGFVAVLLTVILTLAYPNHMTSSEQQHEKEVALVNTGLSKKDAIGVSHEEHEGLMKFCDEVATKFGLESHHRPVEPEIKEADEKPPPKPPRPSSKATSSQSTVLPIDSDDHKAVSQLDGAGASHSIKVIEATLVESEVALSTYEGLMKFCDEVATKFGLELHHRPVEPEIKEADEKPISPPPKPPRPSSKATSSQSTVLPIDSDDHKAVSQIDGAGASHSIKVTEATLVESEVAPSSYEPLEIGINPNDFHDA